MPNQPGDKNSAILKFIKNNPNKVVLEPRNYDNVLTYAFSERFYPLTPEQFPNRRLHVILLSHTEINENHDLINSFFTKVKSKTLLHYTTVWLTTSHLTDLGLALVEISFE